MNNIKLGECYYDEHNGRWLTVIGVSRDVVLCDVEELDDYGETRYVDTNLFTRIEMLHCVKLGG